jgi:hypothetical protein
MVEEQQFGGESGEKANCKLKPGECRFVLESFKPYSGLEKPEDWVKRQSSQSHIYPMDINGHFLTGLTCILDGVNTLVIFDTMQGSHLAGEHFPAAFDFAFSR